MGTTQRHRDIGSHHPVIGIRMQIRLKRFFKFGLLLAMITLAQACSPVYTWGYAPTIHPEATTAYIHAVMARENGDYESALLWYNKALRRTDSDKVRSERDEVEQLNNSHP